jgi:hypothetical protein
LGLNAGEEVSGGSYLGSCSASVEGAYSPSSEMESTLQIEASR